MNRCMIIFFIIFGLKSAEVPSTYFNPDIKENRVYTNIEAMLQAIKRIKSSRKRPFNDIFSQQDWADCKLDKCRFDKTNTIDLLQKARKRGEMNKFLLTEENPIIIEATYSEKRKIDRYIHKIIVVFDNLMSNQDHILYYNIPDISENEFALIRMLESLDCVIRKKKDAYQQRYIKKGWDFDPHYMPVTKKTIDAATTLLWYKINTATHHIKKDSALNRINYVRNKYGLEMLWVQQSINNQKDSQPSESCLIQ